MMHRTAVDDFAQYVRRPTGAHDAMAVDADAMDAQLFECLFESDFGAMPAEDHQRHVVVEQQSRPPETASYRRKKDRAKLCRKLMSDGFARLFELLHKSSPSLKATDRPGILRIAIDKLEEGNRKIDDLETRLSAALAASAPLPGNAPSANVKVGVISCSAPSSNTQAPGEMEKETVRWGGSTHPSHSVAEVQQLQIDQALGKTGDISISQYSGANVGPMHHPNRAGENPFVNMISDRVQSDDELAFTISGSGFQDENTYSSSEANVLAAVHLPRDQQMRVERPSPNAWAACDVKQSVSVQKVLLDLEDPLEYILRFLEPRDVLVLSAVCRRLRDATRVSSFWAEAWQSVFRGYGPCPVDKSQAWSSFVHDMGMGQHVLTHRKCFKNGFVRSPNAQTTILGCGKAPLYATSVRRDGTREWARGCVVYSLVMIGRSNGYLTRTIRGRNGMGIPREVVELQLILANPGLGEKLVLHRKRSDPFQLRVGNMLIAEAWADDSIVDDRFLPNPNPTTDMQMELKAYEVMELSLCFALPPELATDTEVGFIQLHSKGLRVPIGLSLTSSRGNDSLTSLLEIPIGTDYSSPRNAVKNMARYEPCKRPRLM